MKGCLSSHENFLLKVALPLLRGLVAWKNEQNSLRNCGLKVGALPSPHCSLIPTRPQRTELREKHGWDFSDYSLISGFRFLSESKVIIEIWILSAWLGHFRRQPDFRIQLTFKIFQKKKMKKGFKMHFECKFSPFRIQTLTLSHPWRRCGAAAETLRRQRTLSGQGGFRFRQHNQKRCKCRGRRTGVIFHMGVFFVRGSSVLPCDFKPQLWTFPLCVQMSASPSLVWTVAPAQTESTALSVPVAPTSRAWGVNSRPSSAVRQAAVWQTDVSMTLSLVFRCASVVPAIHRVRVTGCVSFSTVLCEVGR